MKKAIPAILIVLMLSMGAAAGAPQYHTTAKGDTVYGLAQRYGVTVAEFLEFNLLILELRRLKAADPSVTLWSYHGPAR